jgi:hypothetical protein
MCGNEAETRDRAVIPWLEAAHLFLLLDGLDEIPQEQRRHRFEEDRLPLQAAKKGAGAVLPRAC